MIPCVQPKLFDISQDLRFNWKILTLEIASIVFRIASEGNLWPSTIQNLNNLDICNVAHLVVLSDNLAILIAHSALFSFRHQGITGFVICTHITIYACPPLFTVAIVA